MDDWTQVANPSNRAEALSMAVRANMRTAPDLTVAEAMQPVAAAAWGVVDGTATEDDLFAAALTALTALMLHVGAFRERDLLGQVLADCAPAEAVPPAGMLAPGRQGAGARP